MKCALVVPSWRHMDTHMDALVSTIAGLWPPTGIMYLASSLIREGHEVIILDGALLTEEKIIKGLKEHNPRFIGISSVYPLWGKAKDFAIKLRALFPESFLAVGGQAPTYLKERCFEECEVLDAVMLGEGEEIICKLVRHLEKDMGFEGISGTIIKKDHTIHDNKGYGIVSDLDSLPFPAYELIDIKKYRPSVGLFRRLPIAATFSSRGCPNQCIYCSKIAGRTIRCKSPERMGDELEYYVKKFGVREVKFFDDLFTYDKERAIQLCEEIRRRKLPIIWSASSRVDTIDRELLSEMKKAGCWYIHYGVESGVQKNLNTLKKGTTVDQIREVVNMTHNMKLNTFTSYILGIPGETYEEAEQTIRFACELGSLFSEFFNCTPFPGTEIFENVTDYGVMKNEIDQVGMHLNSFHPFTMNEREMRELRRRAFLEFYLRREGIWKQFSSIRSFQDFYYRILGLRAIIKLLLSKGGDDCE